MTSLGELMAWQTVALGAIAAWPEGLARTVGGIGVSFGLVVTTVRWIHARR